MIDHQLKTGKFFEIFFILLITVSANAENKQKINNEQSTNKTSGILNAGFVCLEKVYNSELMAPYDILQHSIYRDDKNYIRCVIITPDGNAFTTSEGITITPHYSFEDAPPIDILIIPSTENSMDADLKNSQYINWITQQVNTALHVITLCDGAFPLAKTGVLNGRVATTFPGDRDQLKEMFPEIDVRYDVNFVADGKFITSVGGALSYEPALYLLEILYSRENAHRTGVGLVLDWDLEKVPHFIVNHEKK